MLTTNITQEYEIPDKKLKGLSEEERKKVINKHFEEWVWVVLEGCAYWEPLD